MIFVTVSTGHFDPLIQACSDLRGDFEFYGQIGSGVVIPRFPHQRMMPPSEIERKMADAELVISHAGTGMLSMLYRLKKRSVVVPKQVRYGEANDGQVELAAKWVELGMAILCMDVAELKDRILNCRMADFSFPVFPSLGSQLKHSLQNSSSSLSAPLPT